MHTMIGSADSVTPVHSAPITNRRKPDGEVVNYAARSLSVVEIPPTVPNLPSLAILSIAEQLPLEELSVLSRTCKHYHALINDSITLLPKKWFARFSTQQQLQLKNNVKCKDIQELNAWVSQYTTDRRTAKDIVEKCNHTRFPEHQLFAISRLMAKCPAFEVRDMAYIYSNRPLKFAIFSPDSKHVLTGSYDSAKIFSRNPDGYWTKALEDHHGHDDHGVELGEFSPDGQCVVIASVDQIIRLFVRDADGHWQHKQDITHSRFIDRATFSPDSRYLITANYQSIKVHGARAEGYWVEEAVIPQSAVNPKGFIFNFTTFNPVFSPCGSRFAARGKHTVGVYARQDDSSWKQEAAINSDDEFIYATFSPRGNELITVRWGAARQVHFYTRNPLGSWIEQHTISYDPSIFTSYFSLPPEVSPNGNSIIMMNACEVAEQGVAIIHGRCSDGGWREKCVIRHNGRINAATFSSDSNHVVTAGSDNFAKIYRQDPAGYWQEMAVIPHDDWVTHASFSPDGNFVMTNTLCTHTIKIHGRTADKRWAHKATFSHPCEALFSADFSPDGSHALTFSRTDPAQTTIWSIHTLS